MSMNPSRPPLTLLLVLVLSVLAACPAPAFAAEDAGTAVSTDDEQVAALAREETARLQGLMAGARDQLKAAQDLAKAGKYDDAVVLLETAAGTLPLNPLTQPTLNGLRDEEAAVRLDQARALQAQGNGPAARLALAAYQKIKPDAEAGRMLAQALAEAVPAAPPAAAAAVASTADAADIAGWLRQGRDQYVAGAPEQARKTFQLVLQQDPGNAAARQFLERIEQEQAKVQGQAHAQTRQQLLSEVDQSWQRPELYHEAAPVEAPSAAAAPMFKKLDAIVLPTVSFTQAGIGRVVTALSAASEEFDRSGGSPKGVNIVLLDPEHKNPAVTLDLRDVSLKRVLDFVTQAVGYQYEVQADAVVVRPGDTPATLDTRFFPITRATVLRMTGGGNAGGAPAASTSANPFSSAGASNQPAAGGNEKQELQSFLQQAGVDFAGVPGSSLAYDGSSIIVTQTPRNLDRIQNLLRRYDSIRQVEIEAKFMEVKEGTLNELGVNWNVATKTTQRNAGAQALYQTSGRSLASAFSNNSSVQQGSIIRPGSIATDGVVTTAVSPINLPIINNAPQFPGNANVAAGASALASITGVIGEFDVNAVVRALSQQQGTDLLSAPKVTVLSGNTATITVAQELRYPQSFGQTQSQVGTGSASGGGSAGVAITAGTPQEFTTRNVGVELKVTPTVEDDNYSISLDLNPKVTEFDGFVEYGGPSVAISGNTTVNVPSGFYQPIFSVRDIKTKVTIWDGATLIMGGLTREQVMKVNDKVPVLGDIPLLGGLFRSKGTTAEKRNLLIFVTADLVSPGGSPKRQALANVAPGAVFQNPVIVTPGGAEPRAGVSQ